MHAQWISKLRYKVQDIDPVRERYVSVMNCRSTERLVVSLFLYRLVRESTAKIKN